MQLGFWEKLKKPIFVLAPMANVTDASFRSIIAKYGKPPVVWTEFVSCEGLHATGAMQWVQKHGSPTSLKLRGANSPLLLDFIYGESERPIVAQIFGGKPEQFYEVAKLCVELGFDGIDINMGCPHKGVEKSIGGSALIKDPALAQAIVRATQRGVADAGSAIPVSVKTRMGYNKDEMDTWVPALLEAEPAVLTMHLRTRKEMSKVPARWEDARRFAELVKKYSPETLAFGNGDVPDLAAGRTLADESGLDGVMFGRGIFGNPWLFSEKIPSVEEKLRVAVEHTKLFVEFYGPDSPFVKGRGPLAVRDLDSKSLPLAGVLPLRKGEWLKPFDLMKKHFKAYVNGFDGAKDLRVQLMEAKSAEEIENLVNEFLKEHP